MLQAYQQLYGTPGQRQLQLLVQNGVSFASDNGGNWLDAWYFDETKQTIYISQNTWSIPFVQHIPRSNESAAELLHEAVEHYLADNVFSGLLRGLARAGGAAAFDGGVHYAATTGILTDADDVEGFKGQDRLNDAWEKLITTSAIDDAKAQLTWMVVNFALDGTVQYASALYDSYKEAQALVKAGKLAESEVQAAAKGLQAELKVVEGAATTPLQARQQLLKALEEAERAGNQAKAAMVRSMLQKLSYCFTVGTPLLTPEGDKPIEQFRRGDQILSRSERDVDGAVETRTVEQVFVRSARVLELHVGGRVIGTTAEHPFYAMGREWVAAGELRPGDRLASHDGQWTAVERVVATGRRETVYNLEVAEYHTYFVGARGWAFSAWTHNADGYAALIEAANELGIGIEKITIEGGVATVKISYLSAVVEGGFSKVAKLLEAQGVQKVIIDSGPVVDAVLAKRLTQLAARGETYKGAIVRLIKVETSSFIPGGEVPYFEFVYTP